MQESDYPPFDDQGDYEEEDGHERSPHTPTVVPIAHFHRQQPPPPLISDTASTHSGNSVPGTRPVRRERSFYDQQAMYSRQMQAMGMGAPFMVAELSDNEDDPEEEYAAAHRFGGFGERMAADTHIVATATLSSGADSQCELGHAYSSRPATLYNTQGKTNDFGSNASGALDYSLYNF